MTILDLLRLLEDESDLGYNAEVVIVCEEGELLHPVASFVRNDRDERAFIAFKPASGHAFDTGKGA